MSGPLAWLQLGGPAMLVLLLLSVAALSLIIIKLWEFADHRLTRRDGVDAALDAWEAGQAERALITLGASPSLLNGVLADALRVLQDTRLTAHGARERIERRATEALEGARRHLPTLDLIGQLAPLVGLLGTVLGMIDAFQAVQAAGDRIQPSVLSGGIWEALLTTAFGLVVAIPTVAAAGYFERRVERLQQALESALTRLVTAPTPSAAAGACA